MIDSFQTSPDPISKPLIVTNGNRSTSSTETSSPYQVKSASFSTSKQADLPIECRQRASSDGGKQEMATSPRVSLNTGVMFGASSSTTTESRADALEGCSEGARNMRGRTATLFIKNESS